MPFDLFNDVSMATLEGTTYKVYEYMTMFLVLIIHSISPKETSSKQLRRSGRPVACNFQRALTDSRPPSSSADTQGGPPQSEKHDLTPTSKQKKRSHISGRLYVY